MSPKAAAPEEKSPRPDPKEASDNEVPIEPPPEPPTHVRRRSLVVLSFWLIVVCLGIPIWWKTTTIYRANLPLDTMIQWADGKVSTSVPPCGYHFR